MTVTYFAYGANLDIAPMQARCPGAMPLSTAVLPGYRLVAMREGWLSVEPDEGSQVEGLLWTIRDEHLVALDHYEDVADGLYTHACKSVDAADGTSLEALVYLGSNGGPGVLHAEYAERVACAAHKLLGPEVAQRIRALGPS